MNIDGLVIKSPSQYISIIFAKSNDLYADTSIKNIDVIKRNIDRNLHYKFKKYDENVCQYYNRYKVNDDYFALDVIDKIITPDCIFILYNKTILDETKFPLIDQYHNEYKVTVSEYQIDNMLILIKEYYDYTNVEIVINNNKYNKKLYQKIMNLIN